MSNLKAELETLKEQYRALKQKARRVNNILNEGGEGYNPVDIELEKLGDLISEKQKEVFLSEWTLEITKARRAKWNSMVTDPANKNGDLRDIEQSCGFTLMDLRHAIDLRRAELDK